MADIDVIVNLLDILINIIVLHEKIHAQSI